MFSIIFKHSNLYNMTLVKDNYNKMKWNYQFVNIQYKIFSTLFV